MRLIVTLIGTSFSIHQHVMQPGKVREDLTSTPDHLGIQLHEVQPNYRGTASPGSTPDPAGHVPSLARRPAGVNFGRLAALYFVFSASSVTSSNMHLTKRSAANATLYCNTTRIGLASIRAPAPVNAGKVLNASFRPMSVARPQRIPGISTRSLASKRQALRSSSHRF